MADWPVSLRPISKFIARAREIEKTQPLVAYYCNYYALTKAINIRDTNDEAANRFVTGLLEKCESYKAKIGPDDGSHRHRMEEFSLSVFDHADNEDRSGNATKNTALSFYAAMAFLEVCSIFGPLATDLKERLRYAKWKAADITKALREGRRPVPGAPGEAEAIEKAEREAAEAKSREIAAAQEAAQALGTEDAVGYPHADRSVENDHVIPPAPALREYETDLHEYQPDAGMPGTYEDSQYPHEAPKYPSEDAPSPLKVSREMKKEVFSEDVYDYEVKPNYPKPPTPTLELPGKPVIPMVPTVPPQKQYTTPDGIEGVEQIRSIDSPDIMDVKDITLSLPMAGPRQVAAPMLEAAPMAMAAPVAAPVYDPNFKPSAKQSLEAQRLAKYAASALDFQDFKTAISNLESALGLLRGS